MNTDPEKTVDLERLNKRKIKLLRQLQKFQAKGFCCSKHFTLESQLEEILLEVHILRVLEKTPIRKCIAWGCGNHLKPDEDLRCKICDY
jgi:hypothetical protein